MNGFPSQASLRDGSAYATGNTGSRSNNNIGPYSNISGNAGVAPSTSRSGKSDDLTLRSPCLSGLDSRQLGELLPLAPCTVFCGVTRLWHSNGVSIAQLCYASLSCAVVCWPELCCDVM